MARGRRKSKAIMLRHPRQRFLTLVILLGDITDIGILNAIRSDLGIENNPLSIPTIQDRILDTIRPYKELCLDCLQPTGHGLALELQIGCSHCGTFGASYKAYQLGNQLGLELEGQDRKVLMQWCYQCLQSIEVIPNHNHKGT